MSDPARDGVPVIWMRGGTSKGGYFLESDLPSDPGARDRLLMAAMGTPDPRQIDGMGGADSLTSKVAVVRRSGQAGIDVDYLFLQVGVEVASVTDAQTCGNILVGVGPFAVERGLVAAQDPQTEVVIRDRTTGQVTRARVPTPGGRVSYAGDVAIDGVPRPAAGIALAFEGGAGSSCGALLPTGRVRDRVQGLDVTLIDNGMPVVVIAAADLGLTGQEAPAALEADTALRARLEALRLEVGPMMRLGDVGALTVPKLALVSPPVHEGHVIETRCFLPHRCHKALGVLAGVSIATALSLPGAVGADLVRMRGPEMALGHPTGSLRLRLIPDDPAPRAEVLRTARKLMEGRVFPHPDWDEDAALTP